MQASAQPGLDPTLARDPRTTRHPRTSRMVSAATCSARRVLPIPPGPLSVTSRASPSAVRTSETSRLRPMKRVNCWGSRPVHSSRAGRRSGLRTLTAPTNRYPRVGTVWIISAPLSNAFRIAEMLYARFASSTTASGQTAESSVSFSRRRPCRSTRQTSTSNALGVRATGCPSRRRRRSAGSNRKGPIRKSDRRRESWRPTHA